MLVEIYFIALAIFVAAFFLVSRTSERAQGKLILFSCVALAIGAVGFGLKMARSQGGDFGQGILAIMIFAPIFVSGLGFLASGLTRKYSGKPVVQGAILGLLTIPAGVWAFSIDANKRAAELELERFQAKIEQTNIEGTFGEHHITVPVAPSISVATTCEPPPGVGDLTCHGNFSSSYSMRNFHGHGTTDLEFTYVSIDFPKCEGTRCADIKSWCERRPALKSTVWCQSQISFWLRMRLDPINPKDGSNFPLLAQTDPVDGRRIRCSIQGLKRNCSVHFEVAKGIYAKLSASSIEPGKEEITVREILVVVDKIWNRMTFDPK